MKLAKSQSKVGEISKRVDSSCHFARIIADNPVNLAKSQRKVGKISKRVDSSCHFARVIAENSMKLAKSEERKKKYPNEETVPVYCKR